jgi:predicted nucleotidyltransferase component of viral defense system
MKRIPYLNNLYLADIESIGAMKMEAMLRRAKFRDYYDIYSILKEGGDINKISPIDIQEYIKEKLLEIKDR